MRVGSWRWWLENRETGEVTIAQFPNWPLWAAAVSSVLARLVDGDSRWADLVGWVSSAAWVSWALLEVFRGVNPWRRLLGLAVILWQVGSRLL